MSKSSRPKRILLVLVHSTQNAGDLALLQVSIDLLNKYFQGPEIVLSANHPNEIWYKNHPYRVVSSPACLVGVYSSPIMFQLIRFVLSLLFWVLFRVNLEFLVPQKWKELFSEYQISDMVIAVPGNQFFSTGRFGWPFPLTVMSVWLANFFGKPLYVLPQSLGPFKRWWEKLLIRRVYQRARLIYLRDQFSLEIAQLLGLPRQKVFFYPDPAIMLEAEPTSEAQELLRSYGWNMHQPSIGVTVIAPMGRFLNRDFLENYYSILASTLIRFALPRALQVVFFTQVTGPTITEDDRIPTSIIYQRVKTQVKALYIDAILSPNLLKACYGEMNLFVASRLHSGIFSIGMGVPTVFIGYLPKTKGFLQAFGLERYGIALDALTEDALLTLLENVWESRAEISDALTQLVLNASHEIESSFRQICSNYESDK